MESCHELVESGGITGAGAGPASSLRAHLSRATVHDGYAFLHTDEVMETYFMISLFYFLVHEIVLL